MQIKIISFLLRPHETGDLVDLECHRKTTPFVRITIKDLSLGIPKSDLLGVTVALIHVAAQEFLAV